MIVSNKIKCKSCGDIIESNNRHDFKFCSCGQCAVDGGHDYLKRSYSGNNPEECFEDLSECTNSLVQTSGNVSERH